jgi:hypothetical protein
LYFYLLDIINSILFFILFFCVTKRKKKKRDLVLFFWVMAPCPPSIKKWRVDLNVSAPPVARQSHQRAIENQGNKTSPALLYAI